MSLWEFEITVLKINYTEESRAYKIEVIKLTDLLIEVKVLHDDYEDNLIIKREKIVNKNSFSLEINV